MSRILRRWKLLDTLLPQAVALEGLSLRRYANDNEIARVPMNDVEKVHGAPILVAHRADLQSVLKTGAEMAGAKIYTSSVVEDIDFENARIKIENCSNWIQADVIIAADGVKSKIRNRMLALHGDVDKVRETGDAAWRVIVSAEQIYASKDAGLVELLESSIGLRWMGPDGHIMCYPIRNHGLLNIVLLHPDIHGAEESWTTKGDKKEMVAFYTTWNTRIKKLLDCVPEGEVLEWKLCDHAPLTTWIEGKVALLGDAAHPMLPYVSQGAAQAVEDGAVLSVCLAMIDSKEKINTALKVYELVRKERAETVQASAVQTRRVLHLHDGQEQEDRDEMIRNAAKGGPNPDLWSDKSFQQWCWVSLFLYVYMIPIIVILGNIECGYTTPSSGYVGSTCKTCYQRSKFRITFYY
jgi:salicylate hydroxylase